MRNELSKIAACVLVMGGAFGALGQPLEDFNQPPRGYIEFDGGGLLTQNFRVTEFSPFFAGEGLTAKSDPGYRFDIIPGYYVWRDLALELDFGVAWSQVNKIGNGNVSPDDFDIWQSPLLVDVVYTIPLRGKFKAFLGGGAGGVFTTIDYRFAGDGDIQDTDAQFGYQGMGGIKYEINENMDIGVTYRFLGSSSHSWEDGPFRISTHPILSHAIQAAFTFRF